MKFIKRQGLILISAFPLVFVSALRRGIGVDYESYFSLFYILQANEKVSYLYIEPGYQWVNHITALFSNNPQSIIVVTSFLYGFVLMAAIFRICKNSKIENIRPIVFMINALLYGFSMNGIRQAIAISIVTYSIRFIQERNRKWFLVTLIVAMLFHKTAVIGVSFLFLNHSLFSKRYFLISINILIVVLMICNCKSILELILSNNIFLRKYLDFVNKEQSFNLFKNLIFKFPLYYGVFFYKKLYKEGCNKLYINIALMHIFIMTISPTLPWLFRLSYFMFNGEAILLYQMGSHFKYRKFYDILIYLYAIVSFSWETLSGNNSIVPYISFLGVI